MRTERYLRALMLALAGFDLVLGTALVFFGGALSSAVAGDAYAEPRFFMICVGLFLYQYVFVQFAGFRSPRRWATCLGLTLLVRASFAPLYVYAILAWGAPWTLLHGLFAASAAADLAASVFLVIAMRRLGIAPLGGDGTATDDRGPRPLRIVLAVLAVAEFLIGWNWLLVPGFWLRLFEIPYSVDPFWTRATGVFLLNIGLIQGLAAWHASRFWTAALTSGLFRALWPVLYWLWFAGGAGNGWFKASILFFSFFDLAACLFIFRQLRRVRTVTEGSAALAA